MNHHLNMFLILTWLETLINYVIWTHKTEISTACDLCDLFWCTCTSRGDHCPFLTFLKIKEFL